MMARLHRRSACEATVLEERRAERTRILIDSVGFPHSSLSGRVEHIVHAARALGLEGIVANANARCTSRDCAPELGRSYDSTSAKFVVGGYSPGSPFDGVLVGYFEAKEFLFADMPPFLGLREIRPPRKCIASKPP